MAQGMLHNIVKFWPMILRLSRNNIQAWDLVGDFAVFAKDVGERGGERRCTLNRTKMYLHQLCQCT